MDLERALQKLDRLVETHDFDGAKELLKYWVSEAQSQGDLRAELSLRNECMGLYRKCAEQENAYRNAEKALSLVEKLDMDGTVTAGTTYVNAATVYKAFGEAHRSVPLFEKAEAIYGKLLKEGDGRLGGLYNNMGLALLDEKRYEEALQAYEKALSVMEKVEHGNLERGITFLNMADVYDRMKNDEACKNSRSEEEWEGLITECVDRAAKCLEDESLPRDGYYVFVAEKCIPSFDYYGYFMEKAILEERVKDILASM